MPYTLTFGLALGSSQTGLVLEAQLKDTAGVDVGAAVTTGFVELGGGDYTWTGAAIPDGHRGSVEFRVSPGGAHKAMAAINPEEAEIPGIEVYHADIQFVVDAQNTQDEYTVSWFRSGLRLTGGITDAKIQVVKRSDGSDLVAQTAMTAIGGTGAFKYDAPGVQRMDSGEVHLIVATATIDGATRTFTRLLGRDS